MTLLDVCRILVAVWGAALTGAYLVVYWPIADTVHYKARVAAITALLFVGALSRLPFLGGPFQWQMPVVAAAFAALTFALAGERRAHRP
ncbi:hypothetical protein ABT341_00140 [Pseudonocardia alni]|uniref:hypothetical protein n=1 Tax=Pseudonocardia alni TaxID=33907 RepID=UPI0033239634